MINVINSTLSNTTGETQCQPSMWTWALVTMQLIDIILSLPSLPWALWILIRNSTLKTELLIFNILFTDIISILLTLFSIPILLSSSSSIIDFKVVYFFYNIYLSSYPQFQFGLCFERYMAVVHPVTYLKYRVMRYKLIWLVLVWAMAVVICVINFIFFNPYLLLLILMLIVCMETFFSFSILKVLKCSSPGDRRRTQENNLKKRAFIIVVLLQIKLLFNYLPYILICTFRNAFSDYIFNCYIFNISINFCNVGHFFQAFLYLQRVGKLSIPQSIRPNTCFRWSGTKVNE